MSLMKTMIFQIAMVMVIFMAIVALVFIIPLERQLDDCRFECTHLQTKIDRLQELSDYISALDQLLPSRAMAELKVANAMIQHKKYREYEAVEQPLLD